MEALDIMVVVVFSQPRESRCVSSIYESSMFPAGAHLPDVIEDDGYM